MVDFVGLMSGFNERERENVASRKDMAKAFADFKAANPYASAAEFQSFIDSYSGGRNYISGGAPGSEIINALGAENQRAQAADILRQKIADASERNIFRDNLRTSAEGFLLDLADENPDFADAYDQFTAEMGVDPVFGKQIFGDEKLSSIFNQKNVNRLRLEEMNKNMPAFMDYLKSTGGDVSSANLKAAAEKSGIPLFMVEDARKIYKEQTDNARIALESDRKQELLNLAVDAIERGDPDIESVITGRAKTLKFNTDAPEFKAYVDSLVTQANTTATQNQTDRQNAQLKALISFVNEEVALGNDQMLDITLSEMAKSLQISTKGPAWETYKKRVLANAKLVRDRETEDRDNAKQDRLTLNETTFYSAISGDTRITSLIDRGQIDDARAAIKARMGKFQPEVRDFIEAGLDEYLSSVIAERVLTQNAALAENRDEARTARASAESAYSSANADKIGAFFGTTAKPNPNAGPGQGNAIIAGNELAKVYDMNMATLSVLQSAWSQVPEGTTAQELVALGQQAIQESRLGVSAADGKAKAGSLAEQNSGFLGMSQTFNSWLTSLEGKTRDQFNAIEDKFLAVSRMPSSTPQEAEKKIALLNALQTRIMSTTGAVSSYIQASQDTSFGPDGWITKGTPQWDVGAISGEGGFRDMVRQMQNSLNAKIAEEVSNTTVPAAAAIAQGSGNQNASNAASAFGRYWEELGNRSDRRSELYSKLKELGFADTSGTMDTSSQLLGMFGDFTDQQLEDNQLVYDYLVSAGNETMILDSAEEYGKFLADPAGYVRARNASVGSN